MNIGDLLKKIEIKQTKQRVMILNVLNDVKKPMTVEEIASLLSSISLSTIYRTMEMFTDKGIVQKSVINDSDKFYYELISDEHRHYAICLQCHDMKYVDVCPMHNIQIDLSGFEVTAHKLELYGYCDKCRQ